MNDFLLVDRSGMPCHGRTEIARWQKKYAPGLVLQPIPFDGHVVGPLKIDNPYGIQYQLIMPSGAIFPRHQSGPGATIVISDGNRAVVRQDSREEMGGEPILKCIGGFAGNNKEVAASMIRVFNHFEGNNKPIVIGKNDEPELRGFFKKLLKLEGNLWELGEYDIVFVARAIGHPNIRICSIMGVIWVEPEVLNKHSWTPSKIWEKERLKKALWSNEFGDINTAWLINWLVYEGKK